MPDSVAVAESAPPCGLIGSLLAEKSGEPRCLDRRAALDREDAKRAEQEAAIWRAVRDDYLEHEPHRLFEPPGDRERRAAEFADEVMDVRRSRRAARAARGLRRALRWAAISRHRRKRATSGAPRRSARPSVRRTDPARASSASRMTPAALSAGPPGPPAPAAPEAALAALVADVAALRAQFAADVAASRAELVATNAALGKALERVSALEARVAENDRTREAVARELREAEALARPVRWQHVHARLGPLLENDTVGATRMQVARAKPGSLLHCLTGEGRTEGNLRKVEAALRGARAVRPTCSDSCSGRTTRHGVRSGT